MVNEGGIKPGAWVKVKFTAQVESVGESSMRLTLPPKGAYSIGGPMYIVPVESCTLAFDADAQADKMAKGGQ